MNFLKSIRRVILIVLAVPTIICCLSAQTDQKAPIWGTTVNGLQMSLSLDSPTVLPLSIPAVRLHLRNVGATSLRVLLDQHCSPHGSNTSEVILVLKDSAGNSIRLKDFGQGPPYESGCGGGFAVLLVPLPPGAVYSIPLNLDFYRDGVWSALWNDYERGWVGGGAYSLHAELTGSRSGPFKGIGWEGTVTSNNLVVQFPAP